ncbi:nitroreductase family protein [Methylobacillus glycogenes]|uniref:nitroreductase family protein n=1 Tax=Methylobacillus glycogenes TaxID=406 RepID=UPI000A7242DA|nr:nitroreductase family protein [Methylobacillus glycogenes]
MQRWSPRAFNSETISDQALFSLFEAARWAPSGNNSQPWRFIYFKPDSANWQQVVELTNDNNRRWASNAGALLLLLSKTSHVRAGDTEPSPLRNHSLDAGAAWASLSLQAVHDGLITHAIGGFDREKARELLQIPEVTILRSSLPWANRHIGTACRQTCMPGSSLRRESQCRSLWLEMGLDLQDSDLRR